MSIAEEWHRLERIERGEEQAAERIYVWQGGQRIGSVPGNFRTRAVSSSSPLYDARPGDFRREDDRIVASNSLGAGDLIAAGVSLSRGEA